MGTNIYIIKNIINKKVYIGKTKFNIEKRFNRHKTNARMKINRRLYDSMNKHGFENFAIELLEIVEDYMSNEKEIYWISFYKSNDKIFGYNMTEGGEGGLVFSGKGTMSGKTSYDYWTKNFGKEVADKKRLETNERISKSNIGKKTGDDNPAKRKEVREQIKKTLIEKGITPPRPNWEINGTAHPMLNKHHSLESKDKISKARAGKTYEEIFSKEMAEELKEKRKKNWKENNPNSKNIKLEDIISFIKKTKNCTVLSICSKFNISRSGLHYKLKIISNGITAGELIKNNI